MARKKNRSTTFGPQKLKLELVHCPLEHTISHRPELNIVRVIFGNCILIEQACTSFIGADELYHAYKRALER